MNRRERLYVQAARAVEAQEQAAVLKQTGVLRWVADDPDCPDLMRLAAVTEETGEVARAVHDGDTDNLSVELVQLAGVCLAWAAAITPALPV